MLDFIKQGGVPSLLIVVIGLVALIAAGLFAWDPQESKLPGLHALSKVLTYTICFGILAGLHNTARAALELHDQLVDVLITGTAESLTIGILGFGVLAAVSTLVAMGHRRRRG